MLFIFFLLFFKINNTYRICLLFSSRKRSLTYSQKIMLILTSLLPINIPILRYERDRKMYIKEAFSKACGKEIPYEIKPRRAGDIAMCYADPAKAARVLGWKAEKGLDEMCADSWRWQSQNPNGYEK